MRPQRAVSGDENRLLTGLLAVAVVLAFADASVVVLALPSMYGEFDTSIVGVSWVITAYAVVLAVAGFGLAAVHRRFPPTGLTVVGLALFGTASAFCAAAPGVGWLVVARCAQGLGGALLLVGSLDVLHTLHPAAGRRIWAAAGTIGLAVGPTLGGVLTQLFEWRTVFVVQTPVAILALVVASERRARREVAPAAGEHTPGIGLANLGLLLVSSALVGALFLAVLLVIEVWQFSPVEGALVVSALPAGALAVGRLRATVGPVARAASGCGLLALGLAGLAVLPSASGWWAAAALALCGTGLGLATGVLDVVAEQVGPSLRRTSALAVGCRHAGLVLGLVLFAPLLTTDLDRGAEHAALAGAETLLDARLNVRDKVDVALALRDEVERTRRGEMPDLERPFADADASAARVGTELRDRIKSVLTRAFHTEFAAAAGLALAALVPTVLLAARRPRRRHPGRVGPVALAVLVMTGGGLVVGELAAGGWDYGAYHERDPCATGPETYPGRGLDAVVQRIALSGLDGAACRLGVTREALVLSLDGDTELVKLDWDRKTVQDAIRAGLVRAIEDADERGSLPGWAASILREIAERTPVEFILGAADVLRDPLAAIKRGLGGLVDDLFG